MLGELPGAAGGTEHDDKQYWNQQLRRGQQERNELRGRHDDTNHHPLG